MKFLKNLRKFTDKDYRDGYLRTQIGAGVSYQIQALRAKFGLTQAQFAQQVGKPQSVVARLEGSAKGNVTVKTLLDIATGMNVALLVQFVSYPEFLRRTENMSEAALQPATIFESVEEAADVAPKQDPIEQWVIRKEQEQEQRGEGGLQSLLGVKKPSAERDLRLGATPPPEPTLGPLEHLGTMH